MLEYMIVFYYVNSYRYWTLRDKSFDELTTDQQEFVIKSLKKDFMCRNKYSPDQYLLKLQNRAVSFLVGGICSTVLWIIFWSIVIYFLISEF